MSTSLRQTIVGILFLALGLLLVGLAVAPAVIGMIEHAHADVTLWLLGVGLVVAIYGALLIIPKEARGALGTLGSTAAPYVPWRKTPPPGGTP